MSVRTITIRLAGALVAVSLAASCTTGESGSEIEASNQADATSLEAPEAAQLAVGTRLGDLTEQTLNGVAAKGDSVVAVGYDASANVQRPLFAASTDGGRTWQRGEVDPESVPEDTRNALVGDVVAGDDGFVAVGWQEDGRPALWTSGDGHTWQMQQTDEDVFTSQDWSDATTWADGRYYIVGGNSQSLRRATQRVVVWTSEDGTTWERKELSRGMRKIAGAPSAVDIAVSGDRVLIAGGVEDASQDDQPNRVALWMSRDGGETFKLEPTAPNLGGGYRAYAQDVHVADGDFHVAVAGDALSEDLHGEESWDGVVLSRTDGLWGASLDEDLSSPQMEFPSTLFTVGDRWIMGVNLADDSRNARVLAGSSYLALDLVKSPSLGGRGQQAIDDGVNAGGAAVLVGSTSRSGSREPAIWRLEGDRLEQVKLPRELSAGEPSAWVETVVGTDDGFLVVGDVAESPVTWSSEDFATWEAAGLQGRSRDVPEVHISGAVTRPDGSVLVVGWRHRGSGEDVMVWRRGPAGEWNQQQSPVFSIRNSNGYGSVRATAVAARGKTVVVAAQGDIDGDDEIYPLVSRDGGVSWRAGKGTTKARMTDNDRYMKATPWKAFRSPANGSLAASAVVHGAKTWVMGGYRSEAGEGARPVVWLSGNARTWQGPHTLPIPDDAHSASVNDLVVRGDRLVATGTVSRSESDPSRGWVSWTSDDGGKSWDIGAVQTEAAVAEVLTYDDGLLALGRTGPTSTGDAQAWSSDDGREWEEVDLGISHSEGRGLQAVVSGVVDGDELRLVVIDLPPEGGRNYTQTVPVPAL